MSEQSEEQVKPEPTWKPARVEIMGHRAHVGRAREVTFMGSTYLEVIDDCEERPHPRVYPERAIFAVEWIEMSDRLEAIADAHRGVEKGEREEELRRAILAELPMEGTEPGLTLRELFLRVTEQISWCTIGELYAVLGDAIRRRHVEVTLGLGEEPDRFCEAIPF